MKRDLHLFAKAFLDIFDSHQFGESVEPIDSLSVEEAYRVQQLVIAERVQRGETVVGYKVGCTSSAIRRQFGLSEPICGRVLSPRVYRGDTRLRWSDYCQPAVEPEFVLTIGKDLADEVAEDEPLDHAIDNVSPGIELHNYRFWFGQPTVQELIASNGIHAGLVIGETKTKPTNFNWDMEGVGLHHNGELAASGIGAEILGGPMRSLRWLVNHLVRHGARLRPGDIVIPGSPVELVGVEKRDSVVARFTHLGEVGAIFE